MCTITPGLIVDPNLGCPACMTGAIPTDPSSLVFPLLFYVKLYNFIATESLVVKENDHYFRHIKYNGNLIIIFSQKHDNICSFGILLLAYLLTIKAVDFIVIFSHMHIHILTSSYVFI